MKFAFAAGLAVSKAIKSSPLACNVDVLYVRLQRNGAFCEDPLSNERDGMR